MNSSTLCSLLLTLCLILISQSSFPTNARVHSHHGLLGDDGRPDLIGHICNQTLPEEMTICKNILRSDPRIPHAKNFFEFSKAFLELALNKGIEVQNFLKGLVKTKHVEAIALCANLDYVEVVVSFRSALRLLKDDPLLANYDAKLAGDGSRTCDIHLAMAHIVNPAISALNRRISLLSYIAFLATNEISF